MITEILAFGVLGMLTALIMGMIISESKSPMLILLLIVEGMFFGWIAGMMWTYMGGLEMDILAIVMPVFVSAFFTIITLTYLPKRIWNERFKGVGKGATSVSLGLLILIAFMIAFSSMPVQFASAFATEEFQMSDTWTPNAVTMDSDKIEAFSVKLTNPDLIDFQVYKSSINGLRIMAEPESNNYMDFQVTMDIQGIWGKPYLKIAVFEDKDGDKTLSLGDVMWSDINYKIVTEFLNDGNDWRSNCIWENGKPIASAFTTENHILPIFHANTISKWQDEEGKEFGNTPEGYTAPYDMFSWEKVGNEIHSRETVMEWSPIEDGETTIKGRVYCQDASVGTHIVIIRAYDATLTDPTDEEVDPIASKVISFEVTPEQSGIGAEWFVMIGLGGLFGLGAIVQRKEEWF